MTNQKKILYFYQDVAEKKAKTYIDDVKALIPVIIAKLESKRILHNYEIKFVQKPIKKFDLELGDYLIFYNNTYELSELKIDSDALSSLNKNHLQAQLQKMLTFAQILKNESKDKIADPPQVRLILMIAFTKEYLNKLGGPEVFTLTKRIYQLKKQFPDITIVMKSDSEITDRKTKQKVYIHAIVNVFLAWFEYIFSDREIKPIQVPQLERSVPKGPLFSIAAGVNGWTVDKATYLAEEFENLQEIANARENNIEACLVRHGVATANADATNLYEHFRKELKINNEPAPDSQKDPENMETDPTVSPPED